MVTEGWKWVLFSVSEMYTQDRWSVAGDETKIEEVPERRTSGLLGLYKTRNTVTWTTRRRTLIEGCLLHLHRNPWDLLLVSDFLKPRRPIFSGSNSTPESSVLTPFKLWKIYKQFTSTDLTNIFIPVIFGKIPPKSTFTSCSITFDLVSDRNNISPFI